MAHTNSTPNYNLPQFLTTDKPAWLTDVNAAYLAIDTGIKNAQDKANTADTNASQALIDAGNASSAASTADAKGSGAVSSISEAFDTASIYNVGDLVIYNNLLYKCIVAVSTPGPWTGNTNWERITLDSIVTTMGTELAAKAPLSAVTSVMKNLSVNTEWVRSFSGDCYQIGKIVIIEIDEILFNASIGGNKIFLTDLPIPENAITNHHATLININDGKGYRVTVTPAGELRVWYPADDIPANAALYGQIIYVAL